jgi:alkylation response protein AidB-like acyl-CoA dehydrogenase
MLLARTDPNVPKHVGISYFAFEMLQDGVDVRPLKEMTGHALFNEVFLTDARVADSALIGGLNLGWAAANTTLLNERAGLGSGGGNAAGGDSAQPGTVMGALGKRVGDFVEGKEATGTRRRGNGSGKKSGGAEDGGSGLMSVMRGGASLLIRMAQSNGTNKDAGVRQDLVRLYTLGELGRFNGLRMKAVKERGGDIAGLPNVAKLSMSQIVRLTRDLGLRIAGPAGMLHAYEADQKASLAKIIGNPYVGGVTEMALFAQAPPIYGGTDQVQRNIIGERALGLPKEPNNDRVTPFSELPKNA